ncbi:MAG: hypothetical protein VKO21_00970 [Candidatus Sericytochromatia bacterium]|nr:hypothetical protein [Candidatus Sericytochromatia bacterium]
MEMRHEVDGALGVWLARLECEPDWQDDFRRDPEDALGRHARDLSVGDATILRSLLLYGGLLEFRRTAGQPWAGWGIGC